MFLRTAFALSCAFTIGGCADLATRSSSELGVSFIDGIGADLSGVARGAGRTPIEGSVVGAVRGEGGIAALLPTDDGGFVLWLDLPPANACAAALPSGYYIGDVRTEGYTATLDFRGVDRATGLDELTSEIERIAGTAPPQPMAEISFGPDRLALGRWFECSTGTGHCAYALTLNASTRGCG